MSPVDAPATPRSAPRVTSARQVGVASLEPGGHPRDDQGRRQVPLRAGRAEQAGQPPYICARTQNSHGCRIHRMFFMARVNDSNGRRSSCTDRRVGARLFGRLITSSAFLPSTFRGRMACGASFLYGHVVPRTPGSAADSALDQVGIRTAGVRVGS